MKLWIAVGGLLVVANVAAQGTPQVNENTGDLSYTYSFKLPKARGRYQPELSLTWSSASNQDTGYGQGWTLSSTYIEIDRRVRPDSTVMWLSSGGSRKRLVPFAGRWRPEVEDAFFEVTPAGTVTAPWYTAVDANGTVYTFARQLGAGERVYLTRVQDLDGNVTELKFEADKEDPVEIRYNNLTFGSTSSVATRVLLDYVPDTSLAPASIAGEMVYRARRLSAVRVLGPSPSERLVRSYHIVYTDAAVQPSPRPAGVRSIERIEEHGIDGAAVLPPTVFSYDFNGFGLDPPVEFGPVDLSALPPIYPGSWMLSGDRSADWIDVDGDGLTDMVWPSQLRWSRNTSPIGATVPSFAPAAAFVFAPSPSPPPGVLWFVDFDGDGLMDGVYPELRAGRHWWDLYRGMRNSTGGFLFSKPISFDVTEYVGVPPVYTGWFERGVDINGDGVLDFPKSSGYGLTKLDPFLGTVSIVAKTGPRETVPGESWDPVVLGVDPPTWLAIDFNGDGLSDTVRNLSSRSPPRRLITTGDWKIAFNRGEVPALTCTPLKSSCLSGAQCCQGVCEAGVCAPRAWSHGDDPALRGYGDPVNITTLSTTGGPCTGRTWAADDARFIIGDLQDFNGDGRPDFYRNGTVYWNDGGAFVEDANSTVVNGLEYPRYDAYSISTLSIMVHGTEGECESIITSPYRGQFADLNGDGILDFVRTLSNYAPDGSLAESQSSLFEFRRGVNVTGVSRPVMLRRIDTVEGGVFEIDYAPSSMYGAQAKSRKPVVVALRVGGRFVEGNETRYWYAGSTTGYAPWDPTQNDDLGFAESWSQDTTTALVKHTIWRVDSHALIGRAAMVETGAPSGRQLGAKASVSPPVGITWFMRQAFTYGVKPLLYGTSSACPVSAGYPVRVITTMAETSRLYGSVAATVRTEISCRDVDPYGNVLATKATSTLGGTESEGGPLVTRQSFEGTTSCKNVPATLRVTNLDERNNKLAEDVKTFDPYCRLTAQWSPGTATARTNLTEFTYNGPFALLDTSKTGGVTKRLTYDAYALNVATETTEDSLTTLTTTYAYDHATGLRLSAVGPVLTRANGAVLPDPEDGIERFYLYDAFGRTLAVAKKPYTLAEGDARTAGLVPRASLVNEAVEAYEYRDTAVPTATVGFRFAVAANYSTSGAIPQTDDVARSISYRDGLGRVIQVRERLGGGGTAHGAAQVTQYATGYRVAKAVLYDGAGRERVSLEPFFEPGEAFVDYSEGGIPSTRATVVTYDDQLTSFSLQRRGQPWCSTYRYVSGAAPGAETSCFSNSSHSASFRLATETRYTTRAVSGRGPYAGLFVATEVIPPDVNAVGGSTPRVTLAGAAGEQLGSIDGDGNFSWIEVDAMGREMAAWREAGDLSLATPRPVSTVTYNLAGQVVDTWDANFPDVHRQSVYDEAGRLTFVITDHRTGEGIDYDFSEGDLGRVSAIYEVTFPSGTATKKLVARNHYDVPYDAADAGYSYVAGKLSSTDNGGDTDPHATTIAYGYDDAGRVSRRDQMFNRLGAERFTVDSEYGADGRVLDSHIVNPYDAERKYRYKVEYDSAGRPVALSGNYILASTGADATPSAMIYQADPNGSTRGAYDALGRVLVMKADDGRVVSTRGYDPYSGALVGECKRFGSDLNCSGTALSAADIFRTDKNAAAYQGGKLKSYIDAMTATEYLNTYLPSGRLQEASATPKGAVGALTQDWTEVFGFNGIGNIETAAVTRNTRTGRAAVDVTETYTPDTNGAGAKLDRVARIERIHRTGTPPTTGGTTSYAYDLLGHLTQVTRTAGESESLYYAPGGELLYRQIGEKFVFYVGEYATVTAQGAPGCGTSCTPVAATVQVDAHVVFAGTRIASVKPSRTLYYYRTRLGSVIATSLNGGRFGAAYRYGPYGEVELATYSGAASQADQESELGYTNALRLTGGLLHLKNRAYDTKTRVFLQADTIDRLRYAYVIGDPVNLSDPTGLMPLMWYEESRNPVASTIADLSSEFGRDWFSQGTLKQQLAQNGQTDIKKQTKKESEKGEEDGAALSKEKEKSDREDVDNKAKDSTAPPAHDTVIEIRIDPGVLVAADLSTGESVTRKGTSGRGACMNNASPACLAKKGEGAIPPGDYLLNSREISVFSAAGTVLRLFHPEHPGDWGAFRVPLHPLDERQMRGRDGIFLHGGMKLGSAGCWDVGGGAGGDPGVQRLLRMLFEDSDGNVPVRVLP